MQSVPLDKPTTPNHLYTLARTNHLTVQALEYALRKIGTVPDTSAWRHFIDKMLLLLSTALILAGVIFFFAYNWAEMSHFLKFLVLQLAIISMALFASIRGIKYLSAQAALLAAAVLVGALLAVYGQIYQTGADAFSLFLSWAFLIIPWVVLGAFAPLWLLLLFLLNLSFILYWGQVINPSFWEPPMTLLLGLFLLNGFAMSVWEFAHRRGVIWLQAHWFGVIIFSTASIILGIACLYAILNLGDWQENPLFGIAMLIYVAMNALVLGYYRYQRRDLLLLTISLLSLVIIISTLINQLLPENMISWLILALVIIGQAALATKWLLKI